jgi:hypothetical protein
MAGGQSWAGWVTKKARRRGYLLLAARAVPTLRAAAPLSNRPGVGAAAARALSAAADSGCVRQSCIRHFVSRLDCRCGAAFPPRRAAVAPALKPHDDAAHPRRLSHSLRPLPLFSPRRPSRRRQRRAGSGALQLLADSLPLGFRNAFSSSGVGAATFLPPPRLTRIDAPPSFIDADSLNG